MVLCEAECPGSFKAFDSQGFPSGSDSKESASNAGDLGLIAKSERCSGERKSYPLQYSYLDDFRDKGAWQATFHGVAKSWTQLSD